MVRHVGELSEHGKDTMRDRIQYILEQELTAGDDRASAIVDQICYWYCLYPKDGDND